MLPHAPGSLRARLAGVLAIAVALPVLVVAFSVHRVRDMAEREGLRQAAAAAHQGRDDVRELLEHAAEILLTMATSRSVQEPGGPACPRFMAPLAAARTDFLAFGLTDADGRLLCARGDSAAAAGLVDAHLLAAALAATGPVLGNLTRLRGTDDAVVVLALAARHEGVATPHAVVFAALAADDFVGHDIVESLQPGAKVWVLDERGIVITHHPDARAWRGRPARDAGLGVLALDRDSSLVRLPDRETPYLAMRALHTAGAHVAVVVEAPLDEVFVQLGRLLDAAIAAGLVAMLLGTLLVGFGWKRVLLDDIARLVGAAERIGRGEFGASAAIPPERGELALVSRSLDDLGARLAERRREMDALLRDLAAGRDRLQLLYDALPVGISVLDREGRILDWSLGMERLLGWRADEVVGHAPPFLPAELAAEARRLRAAALDRAETISYETERLCKDGSRLPVSVFVSPVRDDAGTVVATVGVMTSIAARRAVEQRERAAQEELRAILAAAPLAVFAVDRARRCTLWSAGAERLFGFPASALLGQVLPLKSAGDPVALQASVERMERALAGETLEQAELEMPAGDRVLTLVTSGVPLRDAQGMIVGAVFALVDVSARRHAERMRDTALADAQLAGRRLTATVEELRRLSQHLHTVREQEQARLAREIHDEFGQLLTSLKMDLRMLAQGLEHLPGTDGMQRRVDGMRELVDQMVTVGRRIVSELRPVTLDKVGLGHVLETLAQDTARRAGIPIEACVEGDFLPLPPETATALYRIAQEALTNVLRHSGATHATLTLRGHEEHVELVVEDDGRGLTLPARPGAMGLVSMRERATLLGGAFRLEPAAGGGTRVVAEVPWRAATALA